MKKLFSVLLLGTLLLSLCACNGGEKKGETPDAFVGHWVSNTKLQYSYTLEANGNGYMTSPLGQTDMYWSYFPEEQKLMFASKSGAKSTFPVKKLGESYLFFEEKPQGSISFMKETEKQSLLDKREAVEITGENWSTYFETATEDTWSEVKKGQATKVCRVLTVRLKTEYATRVFMNQGETVSLQFTYDYVTRKVSVDFKKQTILPGDPAAGGMQGTAGQTFSYCPYDLMLSSQLGKTELTKPTGKTACFYENPALVNVSGTLYLLPVQ